MKTVGRASPCVGMIPVTVLALSIIALVPAPAFSVPTTSCTDTRVAALDACQSDADAEHSLAIGMCDNVSNPAARASCITGADSARTDALDACDEQDAARTDVCSALGEAPYDPPINPANFVDPAKIGFGIAPNRFFPITRGLQWTYQGSGEINIVTVTTKTKQILGVKCAVIHDVVREDGVVTEDTEDWYAQDLQGNVWYFGEISRQFENGELVGIEGSWKAGRNLARPGILMLASPQVGATYRQEFLLGDAEDLATVISLIGSASAPAASCNGNCVVTNDFTPLEPGQLERKFFKRGVGLIQERDPVTGLPLSKLVEFEQL